MLEELDLPFVLPGCLERFECAQIPPSPACVFLHGVKPEFTGLESPDHGMLQSQRVRAWRHLSFGVTACPYRSGCR